MVRFPEFRKSGHVKQYVNGFYRIRNKMTHFLDPNALTDFGTFLQYIRYGPQNEQDIGLLGLG